MKIQLSFESAGGAKTKSFAKLVKFILGVCNHDEYKGATAFQGYGIMLIGVSNEGIGKILPRDAINKLLGQNKQIFGSTNPSKSRLNKSKTGDQDGMNASSGLWSMSHQLLIFK